MSWIDAGGGYQIRLADNGKVVCRNAKGRQLSAVPAALREDPEVVRLRHLAEWLKRHDAECLATVDRWMVRSLPVATAVLVEVWQDTAWRMALTDLVVRSGEEIGFLRDADPERGVGIVTLDGDTRRSRPPVVHVPHPVLLADLEDLREFGAELGINQRVQQLYRQTFQRPAALPAGTRSVDQFANARFAQLNHAISRCRTLGYGLRGGSAICPIFEGGVELEAVYWLGEGDPHYETSTGDLVWVRADGGQVALTDVGPVAWSEGMRMASAIYASRVVEESAA